MATEASIQVDDRFYVIDCDHLSPVGTKITAHEHMDLDSVAVVEVVEHLWELTEARRAGGSPELRVWLKTRLVQK